MNLNELTIGSITKSVKALLPSLQAIPTRFRAYQLGNAGASFSYFDGKTFTLLEARVTDISRPNVTAELKACKKTRLDTLHITSWDRDHCNLSELDYILSTWQPKRVEYPGYQPSTDCGKACLARIVAYCQATRERKGIAVTPEYIKSLESAAGYGYKDIVYHPKTIVDKSNDNSTVKLYRTGCFNVLSLGDVESTDIAALIKACRRACSEVDVLILPHHGADNGFMTSDFLDEIAPKLAVCAASNSNQHGHPAPTIRALLDRKGVEVATTVRGDVLVWSENGTSKVSWVDTMASTTAVHKGGIFAPKKYDKLSQHADNIRARRVGAPYRSL